MREHLVLPVCAGATAGCVTAEQWGLPREPLSVRSPDQHLTAYVHNHASFDPPDQSIGVRDAAGRETDVLRLGPDSDWCDLAVWSGDSSTVAFLVQSGKPAAAGRQPSDVRRQASTHLGNATCREPRRYATRSRTSWSVSGSSNPSGIIDTSDCARVRMSARGTETVSLVVTTVTTLSS